VKSRTVFGIGVADCPIICSSKLQFDVATSTMAAEFNPSSMSMIGVKSSRNNETLINYFI